MALLQGVGAKIRHDDVLDRLSPVAVESTVTVDRVAVISRTDKGDVVSMLPGPGRSTTRHYLVFDDPQSPDGRRVLNLRCGYPHDTRTLHVGTSRRLVLAALKIAFAA